MSFTKDIEAIQRVDSPKNGLVDLLKHHKFIICPELRHNPGLQGSRFGRFSVWLLPAVNSGTDWGLHLEFGSGLRDCCASSGVRSSSGLALVSLL